MHALYVHLSLYWPHYTCSVATYGHLFGQASSLAIVYRKQDKIIFRWVASSGCGKILTQMSNASSAS